MKINDGIFPIPLGDDTIELKADINAIRRICKQFGGLQDAIRKLLASDLDSIAAVVQIGANLNKIDAHGLDGRLFAQGLSTEYPGHDGKPTSLLNEVVAFALALGNAGKRRNLSGDDDADAGAGASTGND